MRKHKWITGALAAVLAFCLAWSSGMCLVTGFQLTVNQGVTGLLLALSLLSALLLSLSKGWILLMVMMALGVGYLWQEGSGLIQLEALVQSITQRYFNAYGFTVITWSGRDLTGIAVTIPMLAGGFLTELVCVRGILRQKSTAWAISFALIPLLLCMVVTDTVPQIPYLGLFLITLALLLMTQPLRRRSAAEANRLTALLLVPVTLAAALLFLLNPQADYEPPSEDPIQTVMGWFQDVASEVSLETSGQTELRQLLAGHEDGQVKLDQVGPRRKLNFKVMEVHASETGSLYLRGQAFGDYDGLTWGNWQGSGEEWTHWPDAGFVSGEVTVRTERVNDLLYFPYYLSGNDWYEAMSHGFYRNENDLREYTFSVLEPVPSTTPTLTPDSSVSPGSIPDGSPVHTFVLLYFREFLTLPEDTRAWAEALLTEIGVTAEMAPEEKAEIIRKYVSGSAGYDLKTDAMPEEQSDFVYWFLTESDTGYCIHFATAAAVLLRAAEVPARYVTGYLVDAKADRDVRVTAGDAHAWVEYLGSAGYWVPLEATPGMTEEEEAKPTETTRPTESTTTRPTESTAATETTQPPESPGQDAPSGTGKPERNLGWLWYLLGAGLVILGIFLQWILRLRLRNRRMHQGPPNAQALARWRHALLLARLGRSEVPRELEELANKAKFSQHTLSAEELARFTACFDQMEAQLRQQRFPRRMIHQLFWAAY